MNRLARKYERSVVVAGDRIDAFLPFDLPSARPALAINDRLMHRLHVAEQALIGLELGPISFWIASPPSPNKRSSLHAGCLRLSAMSVRAFWKHSVDLDAASVRVAASSSHRDRLPAVALINASKPSMIEVLVERMILAETTGQKRNAASLVQLISIAFVKARIATCCADAPSSGQSRTTICCTPGSAVLSGP